MSTCSRSRRPFSAKVVKTTHSDAINLSVPTHDEQMVSHVLNQQQSVEQVGRIADSQSQEIIETLMQDNSAADTSDDNMCDEITNATIGAVRSSVQMIVQQAAHTAWAQDDHVGAATLTTNCVSKHFNTADEDMPLRTSEIAYDCGHSHDEISGFCFKLQGGGTRDRGSRANPLSPPSTRLEISSADLYELCLSPIRWHSKDPDVASPSYRPDREVRIQWCRDELIREGQVDTA